MPRRGERFDKPRLPNENDPDSLTAWMMRFLEWLRAHAYSERTVENRITELGFFIRWADARGLVYPQEVTRPALEGYQRHLFHLRKPNGRPLSFRAQRCRLVPIRAMFAWLTRQNVLLANPASELELPKMEKRLPRNVLTATEAEQVIAVPDIHDPIGLRDRAILEVFYSCGLRRNEMCRLRVVEVDFERRTVFVREGKGRKDRMIPIGERALAWVLKYLDEVRPGLVLGDDDGTLFLTGEGLSITPNRMTQMVRDYVTASGVPKTGSCHVFRHTMATLMLEGGADIRFIQQMLGHASLETTQIYTQVSIRQLMLIHAATHPAAKLEKPIPKPEADDEADGEAVEPTAEALHAALDAEAEDDPE